MSAKKAAKKPASKRGGKREGAGRKKSPDGPRIQLSLPGRLREPLEAIKTATGEKSSSAAVTGLIESAKSILDPSTAHCGPSGENETKEKP